jgi:hypothetical protein
MRHAFQQLPEIHALIGAMLHRISQHLAEQAGQFEELRELC